MLEQQWHKDWFLIIFLSMNEIPMFFLKRTVGINDNLPLLQYLSLCLISKSI
jgi:hypothetical protein